MCGQEVLPSSLEGAPQPEAGVQGDDQEMGLELVLQVEWVGYVGGVVGIVLWQLQVQGPHGSCPPRPKDPGPLPLSESVHACVSPIIFALSPPGRPDHSLLP